MVMLEISNFLHFVGLALGVGGVTVAMVISIRAEKDKELAPAVMKLMGSISKLIWLGLILLIISGVGVTMYVKWPLDKQMLIVKHVVVAWIVIIGIVIGKSAKKANQLAPRGDEKPSLEFLKVKKRMKAFSIINFILWYLVVLISVFV